MRRHHMEEGKEKIRAVMVSRTPGGGGGERRWQQPASQRCDATNRAHDEHQTAVAREYRHRSPAAEPPAHPGRAGLSPRGAAIAVVHLCLRRQSKARPG